MRRIIMSRYCEKVGAVLPIYVRNIGQPEPGFIRQCRGLERYGAPLASHVRAGSFPQFPVDQRGEFIGCRLISLGPGPQQTSDFSGWIGWQSASRENKLQSAL
jgi:hypothetical protein